MTQAVRPTPPSSSTISMEWVHTNKGWLNTLAIPGDGNCLFSAIVDQITNLGIPNLRNWGAARLRHEVVEHILNNQDRFQAQILDSINELAPRYDLCDPRKKVKSYIEDLRRDGFWGGAETIKAVCNMANAEIIIHQMDGTEIRFSPDSRRSDFTMNLLYRGSGGASANHFDSIRELKRAGVSQQGHTVEGIGMNRNRNSQRTERDTCRTKQSRAESDANFYPQFNLTQSNGYEVEIRDPTVHSSAIQSNKNRGSFKIGTWNVRGCSKEDKRTELSSILKNNNLAVVCIQESHLSSGQYTNPHYTWHLSGGTQSRTYRGVAILTGNDAAQMEKFCPYSENIAAGVVWISGIRVTMITCHIPNDPTLACLEFQNLSEVISAHAKSGGPIIIAGDFNAHLGTQDTSEKDKQLIGPMLYHQQSNENGHLLKNLIILHNLTVQTSWSYSKSVLTTWSNGQSVSQLDHILSLNNYPELSIWCKAKWMQAETLDPKLGKPSDHKLVYAKIAIRIGKKRWSPKLGEKRDNKKWNIGRLKDKESNEAYKRKIKADLAELLGPKEANHTLEANREHPEWYAKICTTVENAAKETLNRSNSPMTPKRRKAIADQQQARFRRRRRLPLGQKSNKILMEKNRARADAFRLHEVEKCEKFFNNLSSVHPMHRMREAYKHLKQYRRKTRGKKKYIPMSKWEEVVKREEKALKIDYIEEKDNIEPPPPPSYAKVYKLIHNFKKGTAPGLDNINIELIQGGPPELTHEIHQIIEMAWKNNTIPESWLYTVQIPIPKVTYPKETNDFRMITLCSIVYKIYAKILLEALDDSIPPLPQYQGAFLADKSTEDHIFTMRRVTEEAWREGRITYILALDLAKAFPSVNLEVLVTILKRQGVPHFLINRIIKACLHERTAIQWFGQTTTFHDKTVGVKQGCPISPRLFTIVLHEVISTTVEVLGKFVLKERDHITLPILLAYADDILVIADDVKDLDSFLKEITPNLQSTGMSLNVKKCEVMIRDPRGIENRRKDNELILDKEKIKVVQTMRYLGAFLTSSINRRGSTRSRIEKAIRGARMLMPFISNYKPPWSMIRTFYNTIIAPVALYGMKATATTKANRSALKKMECLIISLFAQQCRNLPSKKIAFLLRGKTIWRRVMNQRIKYWAHIARRPSNNILQVAKRIHPSKKKIGRPCFTWNESLEDDIRRSKIPIATWEDAAGNKENLKKLADKIYEIEDSSEEDEITNLDGI